jgi:thiamine-monophosphate kinase
MSNQMNQTKNQPLKGRTQDNQMIQNHLTPMPNMPIPFGDDVSGVNLDENRIAVLKTDMLVGKTDVPKDMSLWQASRKALVMNISDFASKGAQPTAALIALGLPTDFTQKDIQEIADGLNIGAQEYGAYIIGGDTCEATDLIISISLFGTTQKSTLMLRRSQKG